MLDIQRKLCVHFWTILQKSTSSRIATSIPVNITVAGRKLILHAHHDNIHIAYGESSTASAASFCLPAGALKEIGGRKGNVSMELAAGKVCCRWQQSGVQREASYDTLNAEVPDMPTASNFVVNKPGLSKALDDAMKSIAKDSVRYALDKVQLRACGEIIGTDGKQMLLQKGFKFPWKKDLLLPKCGAFALLPNEEVQVGCNGKHVIFKVGGWSVALLADLEGRFPSVDQIVPRGCSTTLQLTPSDAAFLTKSLRQLPGSRDQNAPLTVNLNGQVSMRSKADEDRPTEVVLAGSSYTGEAITFVVGRQLMQRALQLGFSRIQLINADSPVVCKDATRTFVWMPLAKELAISPSKDANRILAPTEAPSVKVSQAKRPRKHQAASEAIAEPVEPAPQKPRRRWFRSPQWWNNLRHVIPVLRFLVRSMIENRRRRRQAKQQPAATTNS